MWGASMPIEEHGNEELERRLAAILAADVAGYSALMGANEQATVRELKAHQAVIPNFRSAHGLLAATLARLGHVEEARAVAAEILRIEPKYTISVTRALALSKRREAYLDGLRMAGLPER